jgi:glycosyltransferase involved in cell wall biosynthesis
MRVLIITPYYLPGYKAGGPIRSLSNLIDRLGDEFDFHVVAGDRDLGDGQPYPKIEVGRWNRNSRAHVMYSPISRFNASLPRQAIEETRADVIYLNSVFNPRVCLLPLALSYCGVVPRLPLIVAPRGAFSPAAIAIKSWKKRAYLPAARWVAAGCRVTWHAASEPERHQLICILGPRSHVHLAPNLSAADTPRAEIREPKLSGQLRLVSLSRICPVKNVLGAIEMLRPMSGQVTFDIFGPVEDRGYWMQCEREAVRLPNNIRVAYRGIVAPESVADTVAKYDALFLPTLGENYGHAIVESLSAGCPVLISDRTPWRNLSTLGVGWDISLERPCQFQQVLATLLNMDERTHQALRQRARQYGNRIRNDQKALEQNRALFQSAMAHESENQRLDRRQAA